MSFASDTFGGTSGNNLTTGSWAKQTGFTADIIYGTNGAYANAFAGVTYAVYQHTGSPASADYSVFADVARTVSGTSSPQMGVCGRMQAAAGTFYATLHIHASNQTRLYKWIAGTPTQIGSYSNTLTPGTPQRHELRMSGSTISLHIDGGAAVISETDTDITTAGKAGIIGFEMRESGVADTASIDNFDAVDAGGGGSSTTPLIGGLTHGILTKGRLVA